MALVIDDSKQFLVMVLGEGLAVIEWVHVTDSALNHIFYVYPEGEQAFCTPGPYLYIAVRVRNDGDVTAPLFARFIEASSGRTLYEETREVAPGGNWVFRNALALITMPPADYGITVEVGH